MMLLEDYQQPNERVMLSMCKALINEFDSEERLAEITSDTNLLLSSLGRRNKVDMEVDNACN